MAMPSPLGLASVLGAAVLDATRRCRAAMLDVLPGAAVLPCSMCYQALPCCRPAD
ncbi:hypothetical protein NKI96_10600 [Mesorhizobium sp. M0292]|uniref:hypothetical protein n=1 Tax=Mesorhizobium sp. M0292 TaxID=2956929 RepID=UPI00333D85FD